MYSIVHAFIQGGLSGSPQNSRTESVAFRLDVYKWAK